MKTIGALVVLLAMLLSACGPQVDVTQTAMAETQSAVGTMAAETQEAESAKATSMAGTITAAAPTLTSTPVPPTTTETPVPSPTPSGQYAFFDAAVDQVSPDKVDVSFGFQLPQDLELGSVSIGALPVGCDSLLLSMSFERYIPSTYSGLVQGGDVVQLSLDKPGKCESNGVQLIVFMPNQAGSLYQQTFDMPFTLEHK